nr:Chromate resistance protein ChrB [Ktedonobacteraceae bacterium]
MGEMRVLEVAELSLLLLLYKVPTERSSYRVYVWRKLKHMKARLLHDSVWVLPMTPENLDQLQQIAVDVGRFGGNALVWEAELATAGQDEILTRMLQ